MRYIENTELREWIKESLRKSIFQKAHALAVQTGCDILVKLEDSEDIIGSQYYATSTLDNAFSSNGLRKKPQDVSVSGDTGLPISPLVDRGIQSSDETPTSSRNGTSGSSSSVEDIAQRLSSRITVPGSGDSAVPMQLSLAEDAVSKVNSQGDFSSVQTTQDSSQGTSDDTLTETDITVKIEPMTDDEPPDPGVDDNKDKDDAQTQQTNTDQMSFSFEASNHSVLGLSSPPSTSSGQVTIGGMTRDTKLYPVPISPKPYQCAVCHKAFRSVQVLQKHTQTFHMRPTSVHQLSRRGRGRGRGAFARSSFMLAGQSQPARHLCLACNRVFHGAQQLEDHMARYHVNPDTQQTSQQQQQQTSFEDSLALAAATQLAGDIPFPSLDDETTENNSQNLEDIPGPSTSDNSISQIPPSAVMPFGQPQASVSAPFTHPPPPALAPQVFGGFAAPAVPPPRSNASSSMGSSPHRGGSPMRECPLGQGVRNIVDAYSYRSPPAVADVVEYSEVTLRDVMAGILLSAGPVNTHRQLIRLGPKPMRSLTKQQYVIAATHLQAAELGSLVTLHGGVSRFCSVFIKKRPDEARLILEMNKDLCSYEKYSERFNLLLPACIGRNIKDKLIYLGYLSEAHFK
ncbi:uncharacterized protein [Amphiura filiformis]|uniref:uncharacterized protein isoform X1 n=1 Tax=Amphiura filiformis TaxID=82378 RepID=UPI003B221846